MLTAALLVVLGATPVSTSTSSAVVLYLSEATANAALAGSVQRACAESLTKGGLATRTPAGKTPKLDAKGLRAALALEGRRGAKLMVVGTVRSRLEGPAEGEQASTARAKAELRVLAVPSGETLWGTVDSATMRGADLLSVERNALAALAGTLTATLSTALPRLLGAAPKELELEVRAAHGKLAPEMLARLKDGLFISVDGVEEVRQKSYTGDAAVLVMRYNGDRDAVERRLNGRRVGSVVVDLERLGEPKLHLRLSPLGSP